MIQLTKWSIRNKPAVIIGSLIIMIMGTVSYLMLPMELLPASDNQKVSVIVLGEGYDAITMEDRVTKPMEKVLSGVHGKQDIFSVTGNSFSKLDVFFEPSIDMKEAKTNISEVLQQVPLPQGVSPPYVTLLNTSMISVANISISFPDGVTVQNMNFVQEQIIPEIRSIKGVGNVTTYGDVDHSVTIIADAVKMTQNNVSMQSLAGLLQGQNVGTALGNIIIGDKTSSISVMGVIKNVEELQNMPIQQDLTLADIATVPPGRNPETYVLFSRNHIVYNTLVF